MEDDVEKFVHEIISEDADTQAVIRYAKSNAQIVGSFYRTFSSICDDHDVVMDIVRLYAIKILFSSIAVNIDA